jgi:hypothetical protein
LGTGFGTDSDEATLIEGHISAAKVHRHAIETAELRRRQAWLEDNGYRCDLEDILDNLKDELGYGRDMSREWRRTHRTAA